MLQTGASNNTSKRLWTVRRKREESSEHCADMRRCSIAIKSLKGLMRTLAWLTAATFFTASLPGNDPSDDDARPRHRLTAVRKTTLTRKTRYHRPPLFKNLRNLLGEGESCLMQNAALGATIYPVQRHRIALKTVAGLHRP
jgi:hypothetical protein